MNRMRLTSCFLALGAIIASSPVRADYPTALSTRQQIEKTPASVTQIAIPFLNAEDHAALAKFREIVQVSYFSVDGTGGTNAKLQALSKVDLPKLADLNLLNSPGVTDAGIKHLVAIKPLRMMQLEGTSITDAGIKTIVEEMKLTGVNVANCPKVTLKGIKLLAGSKTLTELSISRKDLTQDQILVLIGSLRTGTYFSVVDPAMRLDEKLLEKVAEKRGIQFVVTDKGAMQYIDVRP